MTTPLLRHYVLLSFSLLLLATAGYAQSVTFDFEANITGARTLGQAGSKNMSHSKGVYTLNMASARREFWQTEFSGVLLTGSNSIATDYGDYESSVTFSLLGGAAFDLTGMQFADVSDAGETVVITTSKGSVNYVIPALTSLSVQSFTSSDTKLQGITSFTVTTQDGQYFLAFDQIALANVAPSNTVPTATNLSQSKSATEGGSAVALDDIVVTDPDAGETITATLTLSSAAAGSLSTGTFGSATSAFNAGTGVWTVSGSRTDVNAALAAVAFTPSANNDQNFTITTRIRDAANTGPADGTISFTVTAVNDAPTATNLSQSKSATEGGSAVALDDIVVTDPDAGETITATLTLSSTAAGSLSTGTFGSATSTFNTGTGVWTVSGSRTDVNAALAAVAFTPSANNDQNFTITTRIRDAANTGPADGTISFTVTAVNDAPTLSGGPYTFTATTVGTDSQQILVSDLLAALTYSDPDAGALKGIIVTAVSETGHWQFTNGGSSDWINAMSRPVSATNGVLLSGTDRIFYTPGPGAETATITFRAWDQTAFTPASVPGDVKLADPSVNGGTSSFSSGTASATISVTVPNITPTATNLSQSKSATEGGSAVALDDIVVTDPNAGETITATLTLSSAAAGSLTTGTFGSATSAYTAGTGVWTVTGSVTDVNAALAAVDFTPSANNDQDFTIATRIRDAANTGPANGTISFTVTGVNDAPVLDTSTPLDYGSINEDTPAPTNGSTTGSRLVSTFTGGVTDPDAGALQGIAIIGANNTNGSWWFSTDGGTSWSSLGSPSANAARLLSASARIYFQPTANYNGTISSALTIRAWDRSAGSDGGQANISVVGTGGTTPFSTASTTVSLTVAAVADAPLATNLTQSKTATEGGSNVALDDIVVTDPDSGETITATLTLSSAAAGSLTTGTFGSATSAYTAGTGVWTVTGSVTDVNAALAAVAFTPSASNDQNFTITTRVRDAANTGPADGTISFTVTGIPPTVSSVSSSTANGTYKVGDVIAIQVNFSENVTVTGTPQLTLETGTTDRVVNYASGSGTSALTFNYTVQAGDVSADLDYVSTSALALNGGSIADGTGNNASLTLATPGAANSLGANKALVVDGVVPTVSGVTSSTANGTYKIGDVIAVQVNFSENVTVTGTPQLTLETGTTDRVVNYASGSGTSALTFNYTIQAGDTSADLDYTGTGALALNGGTIRDGAGNNGTLTLASPGAANSLGANKALVVDGVVPTVSGVTSSTANGTYKIGDVIAVQVNFSENVTVTGTPQLTLETGTTDRVVNYASGTGTSSLTFNYTIQAGDTSADLDYTGTGALALNGGTIRDGAGNNGTLTLASPGAANSLGANTALVVDGIVPTVTGVSSSTANGSYKAGDVIAIQVNFSENVTVAGGTPQLTLETGTTDRVVNYASGTGTSSLTFNYTIQAGDTSADLDYTGAGSLALNGSTILDATGNDATLTLASPGAANSLGANKALVIDGTAPVVTNVTSNTVNGTYKAGNVISLQVVFSEAVTVTGTPQVSLETGTNDRAVNYTSGSGTTTLTFSYTVQAGDESADLDYTAVSALALNGGSIADAVGNGAVLTLAAPGATNSLGANKAIRIDTAMPVVSSLSSSATNSTYMAGEIIAVQVNFSENVTVTGTPQLTLETGTTDRIATYASGSGSSTLVFNYTIQVGDESADLDAVSTTALALNGGTIADAAGNAAVLTLPAPGAAGSLGANKALVVDGIAPTVSISSATASLTNASPISITITFNETMSGFNGADIAVTNGTVSNVATTDQKVFTADITPAADGAITVNIAANAAADPAGNGNTVATTFNRTYDGTAPAVPLIQSPTDGTTITNTATPTISGTAETNSTVTIRVDGNVAGTATANGSGNWSFSTAALVNGAHTVSARATDAAGNTGSYSANTSFTINTSATIAAGAISGPVNGTYGSVSASVQFSLSGVNLTEAVTVTAPAGFAVSLNNTAFSTSVQVGSAGTLAATPIYVRSLAALAAGNHSVNITASSSGAATQQVAVTAAIQQRALTVSAGAANKVYNGTTTATATLTDDRLSGDVLSVASTSATFDNKNVGTGKTVTVSGISISGAAAANYTVNTTATTTANITPYPLTVTAGASDKVYDGTTTATVTLTDNRVSGDVLTATSTAAAFDTKNAGTGKTVTVSGISISGASAGNYTVNTTATATAAITPKALTATAAASNKVYDGSTAATVTMSDNRVSGDVLTVATTSAAFDTKNTGIGKTVTVSGISISGANAANYTVNTSASATASITAKGLTITADDKTRFMGQPNPAFTASYSGFVSGEDASVLTTQPQFSTTANAASPTGDYPIVVSGAAAQNYSITYVNGTLRVGQGAPTGISLAAATLLENQASGTLAGTLSSTSPDASASHTYTLVSGTGSADNASFSISGNQLLTAASLNYENKSSYQVRVRSTNQYGLSLDQEFVVQLSDVNEAPTLAAITNQAFCFDANTRTITLTGITAGPETGQTMSLAVSSNNASLFSQLSVSTVSSGAAVLTYRMTGPGTARVTVTVTDNGGTANGGVATFSQSFDLTANNQTAATISSDLGLSISKGATAILTASGGTTYQWAAAAGIIGGVNGAALTVRPTQTTTYQVTVTNATGCVGTASVTITVLEDYKVEANNYMSPDGDGVNDNLVIKNLDMYPNNEVKIYDRAGRMLYSKKNYTNDWNGTFQGAPLASDTYYYIVDFGPGRPPIKGFVTITRPN